MNGKQAKRLRRLAREETFGSPERRYRQRSKTGEIVLDPRCTRAVYKQLKRDYKRGR